MTISTSWPPVWSSSGSLARIPALWPCSSVRRKAGCTGTRVAAATSRQSLGDAACLPAANAGSVARKLVKTAWFKALPAPAWYGSPLKDLRDDALDWLNDGVDLPPLLICDPQGLVKNTTVVTWRSMVLFLSRAISSLVVVAPSPLHLVPHRPCCHCAAVVFECVENAAMLPGACSPPESS